MTLTTVQIESRVPVQAAVIWMHGLGADAHDFVPIVKELDLRELPGIRFVFPNAPEIPVTINNGYVMRAWYDIMSNDLVRREDETGLRQSQIEIEKLIALQHEAGIPYNRIFLAGFSQGCAMTFQTGLRFHEKLGGMLCLSGYLPLAQKIEAERHIANQDTPIFMAHGSADNVVPIARAIQSRDQLIALGYKIEWHDYLMQHSVHPTEIEHIGHWFRKHLKE